MPKTLKIDPEVQANGRHAVMGLLRFYMMGSHVSFAELATRLNDAGIEENERNLRNKIARGEMQASFFLICLKLLGCNYLPLEELPMLVTDDLQLRPKGWKPAWPNERHQKLIEKRRRKTRKKT